MVFLKLDRDKNLLVNFEGTKIVIDECKKAGVQRLIYSSSVTVIFNWSELRDADEATPYNTEFANAYSESKCLAEQALLAANQGSLATCALRLRGIWGPGEIRTTQRTVVSNVLFTQEYGCVFTGKFVLESCP